LVALGRRPRRLAFAPVERSSASAMVPEPTGLRALCADAIRSLDELIRLRDRR
jgi:hypothetical protein